MNTSTVAPVVTYDPSMGHIYPIPIAVATLVVSVLGVFCNILILLVIVSSKQLHNRCYVLIGYLALSDLICSIYYSLLRVLIFTYNYYLTNYTCFMYSFVGLFALNTQTGLTVMLGVDRFLAVFAPYKYRQWKGSIYILCMVIPPNIYAIIVTGYGWIEATSAITVPVCFPPSAYNSTSRNVWVISNGVIVILVLVLYSAAQIKFKVSQSFSNSDSSMKIASRVLRSLMVVMIVYASTWAFTMVMMLIISFVVYNTPAQKIVEIFLVWPVVINASSNFFIYFWRTLEFRRATLQLFRCFKPGTKNTSVNDFKTSTVATVSFSQKQCPAPTTKNTRV